jgi:hypothetical protein
MSRRHWSSPKLRPQCTSISRRATKLSFDERGQLREGDHFSDFTTGPATFLHYAGPITFQKTTRPVPLQAIVTSQAFAS